MKINIISDHRGLQGSLMNLFDFQQYLRDVEKIDVVFHCGDIDKLRESVNDSFRNYQFYDVVKMRDIVLSTTHTAITDFKSLLSMYRDKRRIVAKKAIVFDSLELTLHLNEMKDAYFYYDITMNQLLEWHKIQDIIFLMPDTNLWLFQIKYPNLKSFEFYKKIYLPKLYEINVKDNGKLFYRDNNFYQIDIEKEKVNIDIKSVKLTKDIRHQMFDFRGYIYKRKQETNYIEQFGRLAFEYLLLGKEVYWIDHPYDNDDGLNDYYSHYIDNPYDVNRWFIILKEMMNEPYKEKYWI